MADHIRELRGRIGELESAFDLRAMAEEVRRLEERVSRPDFWNDSRQAAAVSRRRSECGELISEFERAKTDLSDAEEFLPLVQEGDAALAAEVEDKISRVRSTIEALEFRRMLGGELDRSDAILSINSGAGGTESQDWVQILLRMYMRWAERRQYRTEMVDFLPGEEAGFKNATVVVEGSYAYGNLLPEAGIHRLVRISPFDANARRHTSFASVMVLPQVDDEIEIEIRDEDLRIETMRSSGAGGQHVNKTDSAVRMTHIPSGIVVSCRNERSQHKNRAQAMKIMRARLYERERLERDKERQKLEGDKKGIDFGSQIRSYVLQPYQLIKDHRTGFETGDVQAVLDGQLDGFIRSYLLQKKPVQ